MRELAAAAAGGPAALRVAQEDWRGNLDSWIRGMPATHVYSGS